MEHFLETFVAKPPRSGPILTRLPKLARALPEAKRDLHGSHGSFLVRKKTFAYFLDNHHGDGIVAVTCKALPGENAALAAAQPKRYYLPAYIGPRRWVALRLDAAKSIGTKSVNCFLAATSSLPPNASLPSSSPALDTTRERLASASFCVVCSEPPNKQPSHQFSFFPYN